MQTALTTPAKYRHDLPQLSGNLFITDGGMETTLIFHKGFDLPEFAAFDLLRTPEGRQAVRDYYLPYVRLAREYGTGFILEAGTWRASPKWGRVIGCSTDELAEINRRAIALLVEIRREYESGDSPMVISGCIGPRDDGYSPETLLSPEEAEIYHSWQMRVLAETETDMITALTMTHAGEAVGVTRAAQAVGLPVVISFTVETDGKLPSGQSLAAAIEAVDRETGNGPLYYMINCAHPTHLPGALTAPGSWSNRIRGLRANASAKSHEELNESTQLDDGQPAELGLQYRYLTRWLSSLNVFGGCCGTDYRHLEAICKAVVEEPPRAGDITVPASDLITYRRGTAADSYAVFDVFEQSLADLSRRVAPETGNGSVDPVALAKRWEERQSLYSHLSTTADQFWVAERHGEVIGFSRSVVRGGLQELTEFFVLPNQQSAGLGRELISRAFGEDGSSRRLIIATTDERAQALYLKSGVYPRFPVYYFGRTPEPMSVSTDLEFVGAEHSSTTLEILGALDEELLGHRRDCDHTWLLRDRRGYLYYRDGSPVGYGYVGHNHGPFAVSDPGDFPAVLAHAENLAALDDQETFGLEVPMINEVAVDYLLERGFRMSTFLALIMTDKPFGKFENYILTSPPFFL